MIKDSRIFLFKRFSHKCNSNQIMSITFAILTVAFEVFLSCFLHLLSKREKQNKLRLEKAVISISILKL